MDSPRYASPSLQGAPSSPRVGSPRDLSSLMERLKDKGRQCLIRLKTPTSSGLFRSYAKGLPIRRWRSDPLRQTAPGLLEEIASRPPSNHSCSIKVLWSTATNESPPDFPFINLEPDCTDSNQFLPEQEALRTWNLEAKPTDTDGPAGQTRNRRQWSDRVKGYTKSMKSIARWDRGAGLASSGDSHPGLVGELIGVGSQHETDRNSNRNEPSDGRVSIPSPEQDTDGSRCSSSRSSTHSPKPRSIASLPEDASDGFLTDNSSELTLLRRDSIFTNTRPSSIVSSATSTWDSSTGRSISQPTRRDSLYKKALSSSSSLSISYRSQDMKASPAVPHGPTIDTETETLSSERASSIPAQQPPSSATSSPQSIASWLASENRYVSDQVTLTGWVAQQRRLNKMYASEEEVLVEEEEESTSPCQKAESGIEQAPNMSNKLALSTIDEGSSDAGCSNTEANSTNHERLGNQADTGHLGLAATLNQGMAFSPATEAITDLQSLFDQAPTVATSVTDQQTPETLDWSETTDSDETMSDVSDQTDESLCDALAASPMNPALLSAALTLKHHIISLVVTRVQEWMRSCPSGHADSGRSGDSGNGSVSGGGSSGDRNNASRKRAFDREDRGFDRGNGDDQDKRRKMDTFPMDAETSRLFPALACPFMKGHPERKWPKCQKGWPSVSRIKAHIYKHHRLPIHCERCFREFDIEDERKEHGRSEVPCAVRPPREMLGVDAATIQKLKSRRGIQNATEEKKWEMVYRILFPLAQDIPSPYFDIQTLEVGMTRQTRTQYHILLRRELPDRIISQVNSRIRDTPEYQHHPSQRSLSTIIHRAVWDAFDDVLPSLLPQREALETPSDERSDTTAMLQHSELPTASLDLLPADASGTVSPITSAASQHHEQMLLDTSMSNQDFLSIRTTDHENVSQHLPREENLRMHVAEHNLWASEFVPLFDHTGSFGLDPDPRMDDFLAE